MELREGGGGVYKEKNKSPLPGTRALNMSKNMLDWFMDQLSFITRRGKSPIDMCKD